MSHDGETLPVHETFEAFQGEGINLGRRSFFVRTYGCDAKCSFCDSAATWHPDWKPPHVPHRTPFELIDLAHTALKVEVGERMVPRDGQGRPLWGTGTLLVLTGGEPTLYNLEPTIAAFRAFGFWTCIETAGHHPLPRNINHITLSPKVFTGRLPRPESIERANEFKIIVEDKNSIPEAMRLLDQYRRMNAPIWLHPEWSKRNDAEVLRAICDAVQADPIFRAGFQVHKLYQVDRLAQGSDKRYVPLGGQVKRGY